jgi:hypothetical protein
MEISTSRWNNCHEIDLKIYKKTVKYLNGIYETNMDKFQECNEEENLSGILNIVIHWEETLIQFLSDLISRTKNPIELRSIWVGLCRVVGERVSYVPNETPIQEFCSLAEKSRFLFNQSYKQIYQKNFF